MSSIKNGKLGDLCDEAGAVEVLMADDRIWEARKQFADACREICLTWASSDYVVPLDKIINVTTELPNIMKKHDIDGGIVAHIGDGNIHVNILNTHNQGPEEWANTLHAYDDDILHWYIAWAERCLANTALAIRKKRNLKNLLLKVN